MTTTQEFTTVEKNKYVGDTLVAWRVVTETLPALPEKYKSTRWFAEFGDKITAVRKVSIQCAYTGKEYYPGIVATTPTDRVLEIETDHAVACVVDYEAAPEIAGVVLKSGLGKRNPCYTLGTWRKRGRKVGWGMGWSEVQHILKRSASPKSSKVDTCPLVAYNALSGKVTNYK